MLIKVRLCGLAWHASQWCMRGGIQTYWKVESTLTIWAELLNEPGVNIVGWRNVTHKM